MTDQSEPTVAIVYPSLGVLRAAHADLLRRRRAEGETPALWEEAGRFIADGRASGAVLDNDAERETAQSLLDYWSTLLYQAGQPEADATLHEFDPELAPELPDEPAPYVGLDAFHDARFFFGRERLVEQMAAKLAETRLLAVVGPSGSGKSSAVLAGLLPALGRGILPGRENWRILPRMVPGSHPLANLARLLIENGPQMNADERGFGTDTHGLEQEMQTDDGTLARLLEAKLSPQMNADERGAEDDSIRVHPRSSVATLPAVLVVDQFEETFTLCTDEAERAAFVDNLLGLAAAPGTPHRVILTMRSDYESWVSRIPALQDAFNTGRVQVLPLNAEELRRAIVEPAEAVGLRFQEGIVEALISEVLGEPAALPLLQFTLRALWDERRRNRITWDVYSRVGGGRTALARAADRLYNGLIPEEQVTARRILLRLVRPGAGLEVTSSRVAVAELLGMGEDPGRVERVLKRLLDARLLKQSEGDVAADRQVEVAHEALVRNWPTLVEWLDDERENLRQRRRLTDAAERWQERGREASALLRGALLIEAQGFSFLTSLEAEFVQASQEQTLAEQEEEIRERIRLAQAEALAIEQTRRVKRLRSLVVMLAALLIGAVVIVSLETSRRDPTEWKSEESFPKDLVRTITYAPLDAGPPGFRYCIGTLNVGIACSTNAVTWNVYQQGLPTGELAQERRDDRLPPIMRGVSALAIDSTNPDHIYAYFYDNGLFKSENSGLHWEPAAMPLPEGLNNYADRMVAKDDRVAAIVSNFQDYRRTLYASENGALTWHEVLTGTGAVTGPVADVLFVPEEIGEAGLDILIAGISGLFGGKLTSDPTGIVGVAHLRLAVELPHIQLMGRGPETDSNSIYLVTFDRSAETGGVYAWSIGGEPELITPLDLRPISMTVFPSSDDGFRVYLLFVNGRIAVAEKNRPIRFLPNPPISLFDLDFRAQTIQIVPLPGKENELRLFLGHGGGLYHYRASD